MGWKVAGLDIDGLKAAQLASVFANNAQIYAARNPGQSAAAAGLQDSAQGSVAAFAAEKAAKEEAAAAKKKRNMKIGLGVGGAVLGAATLGFAAPALAAAGGGAAAGAGGLTAAGIPASMGFVPAAGTLAAGAAGIAPGAAGVLAPSLVGAGIGAAAPAAFSGAGALAGAGIGSQLGSGLADTIGGDPSAGLTTMADGLDRAQAAYNTARSGGFRPQAQQPASPVGYQGYRAGSQDAGGDWYKDAYGTIHRRRY